MPRPLSVFRYPGSKQKVAGEILSRLEQTINREKNFHDVFVGGGAVLQAVAERWADIPLFANDADKDMAAFWTLVAREDTEPLLEKLRRTPVTLQTFRELRESPPTSMLDRAFAAVFLNRTAFSGILSAGPIGGWGQKSVWKIDCRFNQDAIATGIRHLAALMHKRLSVTCLDFQRYLHATPLDACCYLDPPYFHKGNQLYRTRMSEADHQALAELLRRRRNWLLSYDACADIDRLYGWAERSRVQRRYSVKGEKTSWSKKTEYLVTLPE